MTTNPHTTGRRIEGWLTQPPAHHKRPSEGHASAVRVLRMVNSSDQHTAAEPVPFRPLSTPRKPAPLRNIQPARASKVSTPTPHQPTGCAGHGGNCIGHPDCADHQCPGHPDHDATNEYDVPASERDPVATRWAAATLLTFWAAVAGGLYIFFFGA